MISRAETGGEGMENVLEAKQIRYSTPDGRCLQSSLDFALLPGQLLLIRGPNGCGKSTLLKAILGEYPVDRGQIHWNVNDARISFIPQLENTEVHFPLTLRDVLEISSQKVDWSRVEDIGLVDHELLSAAWNTASGGERKRALLTRSLLNKPEVLVFDEPMNHLDATSRQAMVRVMSAFLREGKQQGHAIVMVCHQGIRENERELFDLVELDLGTLIQGGI